MLIVGELDGVAADGANAVQIGQAASEVSLGLLKGIGLLPRTQIGRAPQGR